MSKSERLSWRRIVAFALCTVLFFGCFTGKTGNVSKAASFPDNAVWMTGCSMTVWQDGRMGLNVYFTGINPAGTFPNGYLSFGGQKYSFHKSNDTEYYATCYLAPKEIGAARQVSIYSNQKVCPIILDEAGNLANSIMCCAKDYLDQLKASAAGNSREASMAKAIDDYGKCAAIFFKNDPNEAAYRVSDIALKNYCAVMNGTLPEGIRYAGSTVVLDEKLAIRHYFETASASVPAEFYIGKNKTSLHSANGLYYVEIPEIKAWDIDRAFRVTAVCNQTDTWNLDFSVLSYAYAAIMNGSSDKLCELVKSLYWFLQAFDGYQSENRELEDPVLNPSGDPDDSITLTYMNSKYPDDMPRAIIVKPSGASKEEDFAANLLQKYIAEEDGYQPRIVSDSEPVSAGSFEISVGNTNRSKEQAKYASNDSYCIQSYPNHNGVAITGVGQLGLIHGAMRFLEACGGFFYLSWDDLYVTNQEHFKVDMNGFRIDYERKFVFTDNDICYTSLNPNSDRTDPYYAGYGRTKPSGYVRPRTGRLYSLAFGLNGFYTDQYQLPVGEAGRESWYLTSFAEGDHYTEPEGANWVPAGQAHTLLAEFLPAKKYANNHPEWYATYDGKKDTSQLCLTTVMNDSTAYGLILAHCKELCEKSDPNAYMQIISMSNNDGAAYCQCSKCVAERKAHGDRSGSNVSIELVELLNKVSKDIHQNGAYPNVYVDTLAYTRTLDPPGDLVCDDHVIIRWAPIMRCYAHYLDAPESEDYRAPEYLKKLKGWLKVCKHVWIWDYNTDYRTTIGPFANVDVMQHDIKLYYSLGVEGIYLQSNVHFLDYNTEFNDIRNYILGRIMQDPTRDYEKELEFYTDVYYGKAGPYVREYMKRLEKQSANHENNYEHRDMFVKYDSFMFEIYGGIKTYNLTEDGRGTDISRRMPDSEIGACEGLWRAIEEIAKTEPEEVQKRLHMLSFSWRIVKSVLNVYEFGDSSKYESENRKLINDMKNSGVVRYSYFDERVMTDCTHPAYHPDSWCRNSDYMMNAYAPLLAKCNPNPTVIEPEPLPSGR